MQNQKNTGGIDFALNPRRRPGSQVERIPNINELDGQDLEVDRSTSSLRANFLPPAFSPTSVTSLEKDEADDFAGMSPVFTSLPYIKPAQLQIASSSSQKLRRKLLRGAKVLIVQAGYSGKRFIYERLKELGVEVVIMDGPDSWARTLLEEGIIIEYLEIDFTEYQTVFERAMNLIHRLEYALDGVTTYYEDAVPLAARIASELNFVANPVTACENARSKQKTRSCLKERGLVVPAFHVIQSKNDLATAAQKVGFPAILKPVYGAASMGVYRVDSVEQLDQVYQQVIPLLDPQKDAIWAQGTDLILEEFYDGDEFDVDMLLFGGKVVYAKLADNWACCKPWFQEIGTSMPSLYPIEKQQELLEFATQCTLALGFQLGAFHVEVKYTSRGPRLIEVNARMGGMCVRDANLIVWGVDLVEEHMMASLGIPICPVIPEKPLAYLAEAAVNAPCSGLINSDDWLEVLASDPRTKALRYLKRKGEYVRGPEDGMPDWIAEIIAVSYVSMEDALEYMQTAFFHKLKVPITPTNNHFKCVFFFPKDRHPFSVLNNWEARQENEASNHE
eukprot:jgi/Galph1/4156/GphlegSOOS_G2841.1